MDRFSLFGGLSVLPSFGGVKIFIHYGQEKKLNKGARFKDLFLKGRGGYSIK